MTDQEEQPSAKRRQRPSAKRKRIDTTVSPSNCSFENEKHQQRAFWSDPPKELLRPIFHKLQESDIIRCAEACVSWESEGEFYAIDISNCLFHLNCNLHHEAKRLNLRNLIIGMSNSKYLVELNSDLLLVVRLMNERFAQKDSLYRSNYVDHFKVYKFDWVKKKWILVTRIGNYAILLGKHSSISIPDKLSRYFKENCIYFIDDSSSNFPYECEFSNRETGLYDMSTDRIKLLYQSSPIWTNQLQWFRPRE
ncbi:hypothetical protein EZV62_008825 [Acer yangbiense]|uniref:KIB1-4 beta-propeller domain-containing protein n=1 Tax=Acer yangbiense TaxID=1000413 RepID=A0A5C7IE35_9ROSI|nr:hypothetical protein EZV62_008825 [Acer yangbiense]